MKNKLSITLMGTGIILVLSSVIIVALNIKKIYISSKNSKIILKDIQLQINKIENNNISCIANNELNLKSISIKNNEYVGILSIPEINIELPVINNLTYDNLDIAPCLYYEDNVSDKLIIAAHNYPSHFGNIKNLNIGDYVILKNAENIDFVYQVIQTEILENDDIENMISGDDWNLTLFTCTFSGLERVTVRCREIS